MAEAPHFVGSKSFFYFLFFHTFCFFYYLCHVKDIK